MDAVPVPGVIIAACVDAAAAIVMLLGIIKHALGAVIVFAVIADIMIPKPDEDRNSDRFINKVLLIQQPVRLKLVALPIVRVVAGRYNRGRSMDRFVGKPDATRPVGAGSGEGVHHPHMPEMIGIAYR